MVMLRFLYPSSCVLCGGKGVGDRDLCADCFGELPWNRHPCLRCAVPLPPDADTPLCGECIKHLPSWDEARCPLAYGFPVDKLVQQFKFGGELATGRLLGGLLADYLAAGTEKPDCLVPVPLHPSRLKERGFNQAAELARPLATRLQLKIELDLCERTRATEVQSKLDAAERRKNLRGAFAVKVPVQGLHLALLDDVVTTGTTMEELSRALRDAGARRISVWSVCRAVNPYA
ncbi:MAG TPA: ComF family protein [Gammaproteobacteria bacterium]|jgi:ComF family protein